jgi:dTDP-4-amino-4,6-dideoxygalactose transaminase
MFGQRYIFFTNYGRSSLYITLKSLDLPRGSKIGVPLYSCTVVFDAIIKAGHIPCFVDIDLENYTMDPEDLKEKISDLDAIVVIHTFGRPADMDKILEIAGEKPVIEDCAHSLLSEYKKKKTGTIGTASIFSLGKYISAGDGGMIFLNEGRFVESFEKELKFLSYPSFFDEISHSLVVYIRSSLYHRPWYGLFSLPIGLHIENKIDIMNKRNFKIAKIGRSVLGTLLKKISSLARKIEIQRENSFFLINELKDTSLKLPFEERDTFCNYYLFPVRFESKAERDSASIRLRGIGVDTAKLYHMTPIKAKEYYGYSGNCPKTEEICNTILTIPNHYSLTEDELIKIAESVKMVV